ncbi:hypothetical protein DL96DRAFT_1653317 [Flagelloscypha sp. PMI_526]|nr:hypothetical protein DL96DRAFT_1653317 [Flagelloscypha sp. PMI_526]
MLNMFACFSLGFSSLSCPGAKCWTQPPSLFGLVFSSLIGRIPFSLVVVLPGELELKLYLRRNTSTGHLSFPRSFSDF